LKLNYNLRLLLVFSIAFSLTSLASPLTSGFHMPRVNLAHAYGEFPGLGTCPTHTATGACSWYWFPTGPEMDTLFAPIFTDATAEYNNLQSSMPIIDFTDSPCPTTQCTTLINSPKFLVTAETPQVGYYEIQFMLANNFWGCNFNFGNAPCGVQIRQGIAHMIDKTSFTNNQPTIAGMSSPIDNPLPTSSAGGLLSPNPCGYDSSFSENGTQCVVGGLGGTAYHLRAATGGNGVPWLYAPGSPDLNAAAQHFVNAGVATGFNPSTSVLTGISSAAGANVPNIFIRSDDVVRLDLGHAIQQQICYMFTGAYTSPCAYLSWNQAPSAFPGFATSRTSVNLNWWMYTAAYSYVPFFDNSLYYTYNSRFASGIPSIQPLNGPCSAQASPTSSAADYMYLCSPNYDSLSSQMETAPCLSAPGDPTAGATSNLPGSPGNGLCSGTFQLSSHSAGLQAEAYFGANAFTLPIFQRGVQFGFLNNGWFRDINNNDVGLPNHFTWLDTYNPSPPVVGTIRQGFSQTTGSVNPFNARTDQDLYIVDSVYDSLYQSNPLYPGDLINWMTISTFQKDNASLGYPSGVQPPPHTLTTYRFTLRDDLYFQDGRPVTSYDVAFSYLSLVGTGAFGGTGGTPITGITILSPRQFDLSVNSLGIFVLIDLTGLSIMPARYWTNAGDSAWDSAIMTCTSNPGCPVSQYSLSGSSVNCALNCSPFSANLMTVNPAYTTPTFDPIASHIFVGSGPFQCGIVTISGSGTCTSTGTQNPPVGGSYTLTRFGKGVAPASSISRAYFRSSGNTALWIWSEQNDLNPSTIFGLVAACYLRPVDLTGPCAHFQQGIGGFNGLGGTPAPVNAGQVAIENRFYALNWVAPFEWTKAPPLGIASLTGLVVYEGGVTLAPASLVGCSSNAGYDC
jgi:Bacterial extracellular solute-binding proteins, family 5 Middle